MTNLPDVLHTKEFINAHAIAASISPFNVESIAFQAGRIMLDRINQLNNKHKSFAFETTLSIPTYLNLIKTTKAKWYAVTILLLGLKNPELPQLQVATRVQHGGYSIPIDVIERRYVRGINNLFNHFIHLCNVWTIFDNSNTYPELIAKGLSSHEIEIVNESSFQQSKVMLSNKKVELLIAKIDAGVKLSVQKALAKIKASENPLVPILRDGKMKWINLKETNE
ncbi:MAG: zeta toxin [Bacteroidia bacterium]|jgi:predicted ABC-type ATPase|nr:zeta toxin [Bacteroidia bacterium]